MHASLTALILGLMLLFSTPLRAEDTRDPFATPQAAENPYHYEEALRQIMVLGIVLADGMQRVIVHVEGLDELAVFKTGDTISINHAGLPHEFTVREIKGKSVRFAARPKDQAEVKKNPNAFSYEVFLL